MEIPCRKDSAEVSYVIQGHDVGNKTPIHGVVGKDEPRTKKSRLFKSKNKVLLFTFFDIKEIVHYEYLEEGQTINKESYSGIMRRVGESIRLKRSEM
ncbi:CLCN3 [Cordylochernes scorpioides]|uniref:CLCN3 n=1 Tax=Cordylochernes scorpioides TaxID=51811 RepID=A0ABY6LJK7_9ARAC|nr:CLCN3 [Cordylochernes scorpioides]